MARNLLILAVVSALVLQGFELADLAVISAILLGAVAAGLIAGYDRGLVFRGRVVTALMLLTGAWIFVAAFAGAAPSLSLLAGYQLAMLPLAFVAYFLCPDRERLWQRMLILLPILCAGLAAYGLCETQIAGRPFGKAFFAQPNSLSGYLLVVVFPLAGRLSHGLRGGAPAGIKTMVLAAVILAGVLTIASSTSRAAIAALGLAVLLFYWSLPKPERTRSGRLLIALALWGYLGANVLMQGTVQESMDTVLAASSALRFDRLEATAGVVDTADSGLSPFSLSKLDSINQRAVLWQGTARLLPTTPWHGFGPGSFRLVYPRFSTIDDRTAHNYAHNDFLQWYVELGLPGVLLGGAIMCWVGLRFCTHRRFEVRQGASFERIGILAGLAAAAAHSFFSYNFQLAATSMLIGLLLARYVDSTTPPRDRWRLRLRPYFRKPVFGLVVVLGVAVPIGLIASAVAMSIYYERGAQHLVDGYLPRAESDLNTAAVWYPAAKVEIARAQVYLAAFDAAERGAERALFLARARAGIASAGCLNPHSPEVAFTRGLLAQRDPALTPAERDRRTDAAFDEALMLDARFFPARLERARILYERDRKRAALAALEHGLQWPFYDNPAVLDYARFTRDLRAELGDKSGAERMDEHIRIMQERWKHT